MPRKLQVKNAQMEAEKRWGEVAMVRETRWLSAAKYCEVGVRDISAPVPPFPRPMIVMGRGTTWDKAFAEADAREQSGDEPLGV